MEEPKCLEWAEKETQHTIDTLSQLPLADEIEQELKALGQKDLQCPQFWLSKHLFRLRKTPANQKGLLERARRDPSTGEFGEWETVFDIAALAKKEGKPFEFNMFCFPGCFLGPDGSRLLLLLGLGGSERTEVREIDLETGDVVEGGFNVYQDALMHACWIDKDHVLINHALDGSPITRSGWPISYYLWKRGTKLEDAKFVFKGEVSDSLSACYPIGDGSSNRVIITRAMDYTTYGHYIIDINGTVEQVPLPQKVTMTLATRSTQKHMITCLSQSETVLGREVPAGTILAFDTTPGSPAEERVSIVYVPDADEFNTHAYLSGIQPARSRVYLTYSKAGEERRLAVEQQDGEWKVVETIPTPAGEQAAIVSSDGSSNDYILQRTGLKQPSVFSVEGSISKVLFSQPAAFDSEKYDVTKKTTTSKDGTSVDYILLSPKEPKFPKGAAPTLLTGYGGAGVSFPLTYLSNMVGGVSLVPWLERGGSLAIAQIRGGGEKGPEWHKAANGPGRQRSYDDFIAVAEDLCSGFTSPQHLGCFGGSNGGLLTAVAVTQRPDLFNVTVSDVPVTDMLRYIYMGIGPALITEYGDPLDPKQIPTIRAYSPYHNIVPGTKYPTILVSISTKDDRVGVGHSRKFVARLKEAGAQNAYLYEINLGGHSVSDAFKNTGLMSKRVALFIDRLF